MEIGEQVHLSIRPEKLQVSRSQPDEDGPYNFFEGSVEDVVYLGTHTRYRVGIQGSVISVFLQHSRLLHDEKPINRGDRVWVRWHCDDASMVEKLSSQTE
jgi:spermidine/putrescine transport system ATP-binding protein